MLWQLLFFKISLKLTNSVEFDIFYKKFQEKKRALHIWACFSTFHSVDVRCVGSGCLPTETLGGTTGPTEEPLTDLLKPQAEPLDPLNS